MTRAVIEQSSAAEQQQPARLEPYRPILEMVERGASQHETDPAPDNVECDFDIAAALVFYRRVASLAAGALLDAVPCPLFGFWGGDDRVVDDFVGLDRQKAAFAERGLPYRVIDSFGHDETLRHLDLVLPDVVDWLASINRR